MGPVFPVRSSSFPLSVAEPGILRTSIVVTGLKLYGYHGLFKEERALGQAFVIDVRALLKSAASHSDDRLEAGVRYDYVIEEITALFNSAQFLTLEALGETLARGLLQRFAPIAAITVTVAKLNPPIPATIDRVSVEIQLQRES